MRMASKSTDTEKKIQALDVEILGIESKATHQGYRDASRRNRIDEELAVLHENQQHDTAYLAGGRTGEAKGDQEAPEPPSSKE